MMDCIFTPLLGHRVPLQSRHTMDAILGLWVLEISPSGIYAFVRQFGASLSPNWVRSADYSLLEDLGPMKLKSIDLVCSCGARRFRKRTPHDPQDVESIVVTCAVCEEVS
jgi:hypothetical protein